MRNPVPHSKAGAGPNPSDCSNHEILGIMSLQIVTVGLNVSPNYSFWLATIINAMEHSQKQSLTDSVWQ